MKKLLGLILTVCMILSVCVVPAYADSTIKITVDGKYVDCAAYGQEPVAINGTTLVPLRSVFEALGATVLWDGNTQSVVSTRHNDIIVLTLNSKQMIVNDEVKTLSVPAQSMNERTMVPVRAIAEAFGCEVKWDGATSTVIVLTASKQDTPDKTTLNMYKDMTSLDLDEAASYFKDENVAAAYFGITDVDSYISEMIGVQGYDERTSNFLKNSFAKCMSASTFTVDTVTVKDNTAIVTTTAVIPDFENMNFDAMGELSDEQLEILLTKALEICGVSMEEMITSTDPDLKAEFDYAIFQVSFDYAADIILQNVKDGKVKTMNETVTLENIDGKWYIVDIK